MGGETLKEEAIGNGGKKNRCEHKTQNEGKNQQKDPGGMRHEEEMTISMMRYGAVRS